MTTKPTRKYLDDLYKRHKRNREYAGLKEKFPALTAGSLKPLTKKEIETLKAMHPDFYNPIYSTDWKDDMSKDECKRLEFLRDYCKKECRTRKCKGCEFIAYHRNMEQKYNVTQVSNETSILTGTQGQNT